METGVCATVSNFKSKSCSISAYSVLSSHFLSNQPDARIIQIYSVIKLCVFRATSLPNHQEFSIVHSALVSFMEVLMTASKQSQDVPSYHQEFSIVHSALVSFMQVLMTASKQSQDVPSYHQEFSTVH
jgi:hypothetical protein